MKMGRLGAVLLAATILATSVGVQGVSVQAATEQTQEVKKDTDTQKKENGLKFDYVKKTYKKVYKAKKKITVGNKQKIKKVIIKEVCFKRPRLTTESPAAAKIDAALDKMEKNWKKESKKNVAEAKEFITSKDYTGDAYYGDMVTYRVTCNNGIYFSVLFSGYDYTLGAHGMPYRMVANFDAKTGEEINIEKLTGLSSKQLNDKVVRLFLKKYDKMADTQECPFYENREIVENTLKEHYFTKTCYIKNNKMVFFTDPYEVGPYAAGFIEVSVPF